MQTSNNRNRTTGSRIVILNMIRSFRVNIPHFYIAIIDKVVNKAFTKLNAYLASYSPIVTHYV